MIHSEHVAVANTSVPRRSSVACCLHFLFPTPSLGIFRPWVPHTTSFRLQP